jgi:hypothetical protein
MAAFSVDHSPVPINVAVDFEALVPLDSQFGFRKLYRPNLHRGRVLHAKRNSGYR